MVFVLGLTGSIGMGKSATADLFRDRAIPVHDADAAVHSIYGEEGVAIIAAHFPHAVVDGKVDRQLLGAEVLSDPDKMKRLESLIHPLVGKREKALIHKAAAAGIPLVVLDIPLLFETGADKRCDAVLVVSAPTEIQNQRVLSRPGMSEKKFRAILERQMPDGEKRRKAHFVVDSSRGLADAGAQVQDILRCLSGRPGHAWLRVKALKPLPVATA